MLQRGICFEIVDAGDILSLAASHYYEYTLSVASNFASYLT